MLERRLEQFKVLSAALVLDQFTVPDISRRSGVNVRTVHSVLSRHKDLFDEIAKVETRRPGGRYITRRLKPEKASALKQELDKLYDLLPRSERPAVPAPNPRILDTVKEYLNRRYVRAKTPDRRREVLASAKLHLQTFADQAREHFGAESDSPAYREMKRRLDASSAELDDRLAAETAARAIDELVHKGLAANPWEKATASFAAGAVGDFFATPAVPRLARSFAAAQVGDF